MDLIEKKSQIVIEFTSNEVDALKDLIRNNNGSDYKKFYSELYELID